ncbi:MAG TPA: uroporphyrinogen decarboxylase [Methylomirabilota bacterium]|nr:uroporphyrinogen decarboxylase [Methylomirabilota bacterium]
MLSTVPPVEPPLLLAARRQPTPYTPVWLMRQAGRYMPEYRAMRARHSFLELCKMPPAAAEVTLQPVERLGVDAAILFADILLIVEPLGVGLEFAKGEGPIIHRPVRGADDVARLPAIDVASAVGFVFETVRLVRRALPAAVPLIGFAGAPFTVASYLVEGGPSRDFTATKRLMHELPEAWARLMALLASATATYLNGQIAAGAQAVQLFDSWVGALSPDDYREFVLPHTRAVVRALTPGVPVIHFGTGTAGLLPSMRQAGGDVIGLDWRVDLDAGWRAVGEDVAVQGNLDPAALLSPPARFAAGVRAILDRARGRPGHIFNLGHGILPSTPVEHVKALVDMVHELSIRR